MNANIIINDYTLIWNLLFGPSITESVYKLKQKLWNNYKNEYNAIFNDKLLILKDHKNFIPNDDTIYNLVMETKEYEKIKRSVEKYRLALMSIWDKNKKETDNFYKNVIRKEVTDYTFFVINKELDIVDHPTTNCLVIGKEINEKEPLDILLEINEKIINNMIKRYVDDDKIIKDAILELAITNEYKTLLTKISCYTNDKPETKSMKRWLYPYWLMYLGIPKEEFPNYMKRDSIVFDADKYAYEKELKKLNIEEFIDFCIRNKRYIVRETKEVKKTVEII